MRRALTLRNPGNESTAIELKAKLEDKGWWDKLVAETMVVEGKHTDKLDEERPGKRNSSCPLPFL